MAVYVGEVFEWPQDHTKARARRHGTQWCHLWCDPDSIDELHNIARQIGLKLEWFQNQKGFSHYDIVPSKRPLAIKQGAVEKSLAEWIKENKQ